MTHSRPILTLKRPSSRTKPTDAQRFIEYLREEYPQAFTDPPRPLAIGIGDELIESLANTAEEEAVVREAIAMWTDSTGYLQCVHKGGFRVDLDGKHRERVIWDHRNFTRGRLFERKTAEANDGTNSD